MPCQIPSQCLPANILKNDRGKAEHQDLPEDLNSRSHDDRFDEDGDGDGEDEQSEDEDPFTLQGTTSMCYTYLISESCHSSISQTKTTSHLQASTRAPLKTYCSHFSKPLIA
jgi:hypothetical protein